MTTPTRADYLNRVVTHEAYYRAVNATAGYRFNGYGVIKLDDVRAALAAGDEHLNTIPLRLWDCMTGASASAFKAHGDYKTLAGVVCSAKQAAKDAAVST